MFLFKHKQFKQLRGVGWFIATTVLLLGLVIAIGVQSWDLSVAERLQALRFNNLFLIAISSFLPPHRLFPDQREPLLRMLNKGPRQISGYLFWHERLVWGSMFFITLTLGLGHPQMWLEHGAFMIPTTLSLAALAPIYYYICIHQYLYVGQRSQYWREGKIGQRWRERAKETGSPLLGSPDIPTLGATMKLMLAGWGIILLLAYLSGLFKLYLDWVAPIGVGLFFVYQWKSDQKVLPRLYYQAHAFYRDYLLGGRTVQEERDPITYNQIYWIPRRYRASAWMLLRQLERRYPYGRMIIIGHLVLWLLWYIDMISWVRWGYLSVFTIGHWGIVLFSTKKSIAPIGRLLSVHPASHWLLTRFWVNIRWFMPYVISLGLISLFSSDMQINQSIRWSVILVSGMMLSSGVATMYTVSHYRNQYK
ncbi:MAG: hypothetical protein ACQETE_12150 [Bacteroidota bacterium]